MRNDRERFLSTQAMQAALEISFSDQDSAPLPFVAPEGITIVQFQEPIPPIQLVTNDNLKHLIKKIKGFHPKINELKKKTNHIENKDQIIGALAEAHLYNTLQRLSTKRKDIVVDPIPDNETTTKFIFTKGQRGQYIIYDRRTNETFAEYDALTEVNGLPVVWEVKNGTSEKPIRAALKRQKIDKRFKPLQEYYERDLFGYVVVKAKTSASYYDFRQRGGIIVSMPKIDIPRE